MNVVPDYRLYVCTDRRLMTTETVEESVARAIAGGATMVQLREKEISSREFLKTAYRVKDVCDQNDIPLIINDRIDIALACDAAGVHLGQLDLPISAARHSMGPDRIIGLSASSRQEALVALEGGADYIGLGALFATSTKGNATIVSPADRAWVLSHSTVPIVGIGGVNERTIPQLKAEGMENFAVVSAVIAQDDIRAAAHQLYTLICG